MLGELGGFLGWCIAVAYGVTILNYILKYINKKFSKEICKNIRVKKYYNLLMKYVVKYHKLFGFLTIVFILAHFAIQFTESGLNITGAVAAILMIVQAVLGAYGAYINKKRKGAWFIIHRIISIVLAIAIGAHLLLK